MSYHNELGKKGEKIAAAYLVKNGYRAPHLAAVIVGNDGASLTYVGSKVRACERIGFESTLISLEESISEDNLLKKVNDLNKNDKNKGGGKFEEKIDFIKNASEDCPVTRNLSESLDIKINWHNQ